MGWLDDVWNAALKFFEAQGQAEMNQAEMNQAFVEEYILPAWNEGSDDENKLVEANEGEEATEQADDESVDAFIDVEEQGGRHPSGRTTWLVTDAFLMSEMDPETWRVPSQAAIFGKGSQQRGPNVTGLPGGRHDYRGMLGTEDLAYYGIAASSPITEKVMGANATRSWSKSEDMAASGFDFVELVEEDVPFTIADAMGIYDAQTPDKQRRIAEGLAVGDKTASYMFKVLGYEMFENPDAIYDRGNIQEAIMEMSRDATNQAQLLGPDGYTMLGDRFIPDVSQNESFTYTVGDFQERLFDMAVDSGLVATISQTATEDKAVAVYEAMTGRSASTEVIEWAKGLTPQMQRHFLEERPGDKYIPENTQEDYIASEVKEMASEDLAKSGSDRFDQVFLKVLTNG